MGYCKKYSNNLLLLTNYYLLLLMVFAVGWKRPRGDAWKIRFCQMKADRSTLFSHSYVRKLGDKKYLANSKSRSFGEDSTTARCLKNSVCHTLSDPRLYPWSVHGKSEHSARAHNTPIGNGIISLWNQSHPHTFPSHHHVLRIKYS